MNESNVPNTNSIIQNANLNQIKFQYVAIFIGVTWHKKLRNKTFLKLKRHFPTANIICYSHGFGVGWLSSALPVLKSDKTPLQGGPLTLEQISWIGGAYPLGALLGDVLFSVLLNCMGRKSCMMALAIPNIVELEEKLITMATIYSNSEN